MEDWKRKHLAKVERDMNGGVGCGILALLMWSGLSIGAIWIISLVVRALLKYLST